MAGITDMAKATVAREFDLQREWTLEEVHEKLSARAAAFQMPFSIKSGVGGKRIAFETEKNLDVSLGVYVNGSHIRYSRLLNSRQPPSAWAA